MAPLDRLVSASLWLMFSSGKEPTYTTSLILQSHSAVLPSRFLDLRSGGAAGVCLASCGALVLSRITLIVRPCLLSLV